MGDMEAVRVAAVLVTYRRDSELGRLLDGLAACKELVSRVVVVDNAASEPTRSLCNSAEMTVDYIPDPGNPGPGAGWNNGIRHALSGDSGLTHILVLDDDVVVEVDALKELIKVATEKKAGAVAPLLTDHEGSIWAFPEPADPRLRKLIRSTKRPEDYLLLAGESAEHFCWCTGACILFSVDVFQSVGFYREDFHILGEDLEFSMRVSNSFPAYYTPRAVVPHLPPQPQDDAAASRSNIIKFCCLIQNLCYIAFYLPYSRHMKSYLPGNLLRFIKTFGLKPSCLLALTKAVFNGALRGEPSGADSGKKLRDYLAQIY